MNQIQYLKSSLALYFNFIRDYSKYCFVLILCRRFNFLNTNKLWVRVQVYFASPKRNCCDSILVIRFVTCHSIRSLPTRWAELSQSKVIFIFILICKISVTTIAKWITFWGCFHHIGERGEKLWTICHYLSYIA